MTTVTAVVVGAGHSGLAMSRHLAGRSIDHVVLERGEVANSWKTERWDSLRLLTPNWQSRLPGYRYKGDDPDGYRTMPETIAFLERYAQVISAPVRTNTTVTRVRRTDEGYTVTTGVGEWRSRALVLASGACNIPSVPASRCCSMLSKWCCRAGWPCSCSTAKPSATLFSVNTRAA